MESQTFQLHNTQKEVALDMHRFRVLCCGRRWGKTTLAIDQMKGRASIPNSSIAYIAPTYQQARDIAWTQLKRDCRDACLVPPNESRLEIKLANNSLIVLKGWEAIETLRGQRFDLVVIDEIAMMRNFWMQWQEVIRPTLTDTKGEGIFISTPRGFNHFYDLFNLEAEDSDYKSFHFTTYDNPHIPVEEIEKAKQELTEDRFAQEYMADFRKTEGLVYKEFNREKHILKGEIDEDDMNICKVFGGVDFGFVHPCAVMTIKKSGSGTYLISDEWYKTGKTDAQIADYVSALNWNECYPDPESAGGVEELNRRGVNVRDVVKGKDSIRNGINVIRELLKSNRLFIHESCKNLIWEFETYSYDDPKLNPKGDEIPKKENDDALDSIRYALMMETAPSDIEDAVQTRPDWISRRKGVLEPLERESPIIQTRPTWIKRR